METLILGLLVRLKKKQPIGDIITHLREKCPQQLQKYLVQLTILSLQSPQLRKLLIDLSQQVQFFCKSRYILSALTSTVNPLKCKHRKQITDFQDELDNSFVNCPSLLASSRLSTEQLWNVLSIEKQQRSEFIQDRNELFGSLRTLAEQLKELRDKELEGNPLFAGSLAHINHFMREKNCKSQSDQYDCSRVVYRNKTYFIKQVRPEGSTFLKTKNRCPLLLNLEFGRFIYKVDNLLQNELIALEITKFLMAKLPFIRFISFDIIPLPSGGALYQFVQTARTVSDCKKSADGLLKTYYEGWQHPQQSIQQFSLSLAGFAIQQYVLQLKDRHNQNIMINNRGQILHIDLSYIFNCKLPWGLQTVPFKLPKEYVDLMGGFESDNFMRFENQLVKAFTVLSDAIDQLIIKIEIYKKMPELKCFENFSIDEYRKCFPKKNQDIVKFVQTIITNSYNNWRIRKYDSFQFKSNGIFP